MRFDRLQIYLKDRAPAMLDFVQNGECRFIERTETSNDQGHPVSAFQPRSVSFISCIWQQTKIDEKILATQTRSLIGYKITIPTNFDDSFIFNQNDRIELRTMTGDKSSAIELEIAARMNRSGLGWVIYAIELEN